MDPYQRIRQLEEQLEARDKEIEHMRGRIEDQQSLLAHRWQCIERLQQERDELRKQNSQQSAKLAEVTRRNSVSAGSSPFGSSRKLSRSQTSGSSLRGPQTPQSEDFPKSPQRDSVPLPSLPPPIPSHQSSTDSDSRREDRDDDSNTSYSDPDAEDKDREKARQRRLTKRLSKQKLKKAGRQPTPERRIGVVATYPARSLPNSSPPRVKLAHELPHGDSDPFLTSIAEERSKSPDRAVTTSSFPREEKVPNGSAVHFKTPLKKHGSSDDVFLPDITSANVSWSANALEYPRAIEIDVAIDQPDFDSSMETSSAANPPRSQTPTNRRPIGIRFASPAELRKMRELSGSQGSLNDEERDVVGELMPKPRERVQTISAVVKDVGLGRRSRKERKMRKGAPKGIRQNYMNVPRNGLFGNLELISPDMEARIREKVCRAIGEKYGGLARATKAATTIQRAYRDYKLRKRFEEIRREKREMTQSLNYTRRRPSMVRKRQQAYRREISAPVMHDDPYTRILQKSKMLGQERPGHVTNRRHLVQQKRNEMAESPRSAKEHVRFNLSQEKDDKVEMVTEVCTMVVEEEELRATPDLVIVEGVCTDESSTDPEQSDLPTSFSSDALLDVGRQLSVFSVKSSSSLQEGSSRQVDWREKEDQKRPRKRALSNSTARRKRNIGINHFNRKPTKGIQYLVMEGVLQDDPQAVADFLIGNDKLSKEKIGEFLGEINSEFNMAVLDCVTEMMSVQSTPIDESLRHFQQTFRMPGEAQKIDKIMQAFALEYYKQNKDGPVKSEDAAYILAFAIMMLHTSLHNPSVRPRHRTTKKQWLSMNRGCNEGENFPEPFLLEIYDRIQKTEFSTGHDHTQEVMEIEKSLTGLNPPKLVSPQRFVLHRVQVSEVTDLSSRPGFAKSRHRRLLFVFNDLVMVCKKRGNDQFVCRGSFSLLNAVALNFETHHYKHGVQFYSSLDSKAIFQCNCDSHDDREVLVQKLNDAIKEMRELDKERITELGSTLAKKTREGHTRSRLQSGAGDLLSSTKIPLAAASHQDKDYVSGVGDLAMSSRSSLSLPTGYATPKRTPKREKPSKQHPAGDLEIINENRSSKDSGFGSQHNTPVTSPSPTTSTKSKSPGPSPIALTPPTTATPTPPPSSPSTLTPTPTHPTRSKSYNSIKTLTVIPSPGLAPSTPPRSPSTGDIRRQAANDGTPSKEKAKGKKAHPVKKNRFPSLSSPFKHKVGKTNAQLQVPKKDSEQLTSSVELTWSAEV